MTEPTPIHARDPLAPESFGLTIEAGVAEITLDRPDRLNALTFEVYVELERTMAALERDDVRVVIITAVAAGLFEGDVEGIIAELFARDASGCSTLPASRASSSRRLHRCADR